MIIKVLVEGLPANLPDLEEPFPICLMDKSTENPRGLPIYILKISPGFTLQVYLAFFSVESIRGFT